MPGRLLIAALAPLAALGCDPSTATDAAAGRADGAAAAAALPVESVAPLEFDLLDPATCASCHPGETAEWQASRHAAAWRDPIFQAEFARGRAAWCVGCHAPAAPDPSAPADADPRVAQGVGCAGCHLQGGALVSTRRAAGSPHATRADPDFAGAARCARCHEFNFPVLGAGGHLLHYTDEPMQATVSQWRESGAADAVGCLDCHGASPAGHRFPGSHDPRMVADALSLAVCRAGAALRVDIENRGAGHHVPTGGVHRRIVLRAWRPTAPERMAERTLGRRFRPLPGGGKETVADTTIPPGAIHQARFPLAALGAPSPGADRINLELRYIYALDERAELAGAVTARVIWHRAIDPAALAACRR